jgi:tRNA pseudouridine55 synthase
MVRISNSLRSIDGVLLLDKPLGMTSNAALQQVKKYFRARKAGHTGSLDPLATGMLPICFGEAVKFTQLLLEADKTYQVTARLGIKTNTGDVEGEVIQQSVVENITLERLQIILKKFHGNIEQLPPMHSAVKHKGKPLYHYARKGVEIERKKRIAQIYRLDLLNLNEKSFTLEVHCSKGTYIRTLIDDIGDALGCGAHVIALRRLSMHQWLSTEMTTLVQLEQELSQKDVALNKFLLPADCMLTHLPEVFISEAGAFYLRRGQSIISPYAPSSGMVRLKFKNGNFFGVGEVLSNGFVAPKRLIAN